MRRTRRKALVWAGALAAAVCVGATGSVFAGKPGGGGGAVAPGRIYVMAASGNLASMDGAGANPATHLSSTIMPFVSRLSHGGARWLLRGERFDGEAGPGGITFRNDLCAMREDGSGWVQLTSDPLTQYSGVCDWGADEDESGATIAVLARRFTGTGSGDTVVASTCGIYTARLVFDATGAVAGLEAEPTMRAFVGTSGPAGNERADASAIRWSPDMTRIAGATLASPGSLFVANLAAGTVMTIGAGEFPDWSPDGSRIACSRNTTDGRTTRIETVAPDGSGRTTLVSLKVASGANMQTVMRPHWSPDGAYLAYQLRFGPSVVSYTDFVYRVSAAGTGSTNLTPAGGAIPVDWR